MAKDGGLGELEHLILLAVLKLGSSARAQDLRRLLEAEAERRITRGALYTTLERLETKKLLTWAVESATPERGGIPRRVFAVTKRGLAVLRRRHRALRRLSEGISAL